MDWDSLLTHLRTDSLLSFLGNLDPSELLNDPVVLGAAILICGMLLFFRFYRTFALMAGSAAIWYAVSECLPVGEETLSMRDVGMFAGIGAAVAAVLVYFFLIRSE